MSFSHLTRHQDTAARKVARSSAREGSNHLSDISVMSSLAHVLIGIYIAASALINVSNVFLLVLLLASPTLRHGVRHMFMAGIACVDLLLGSFVCPLYARSAMHQRYPGCHLHLALQVIGDHGVFFVSGWSLALFNAVIIYQRLRARFRWRLVAGAVPQTLCNVTLVLVPWLVALVVLVPLLVTHATAQEHLWQDPLCMLNLPKPTLIVTTLLTIYLPFSHCFCSAIIIIIVSRKRTPLPQSASAPLEENLNTDIGDHSPEDNNHDEPETHLNSENIHESSPDHPLCACVPSLVYLLCYMPLLVHTGLFVNHLMMPEGVYVYLVLSIMARSFLLPFSWLVFKSVRNEVQAWWRCCRNMFSSNYRPSVNVNGVSTAITFSRLRETQPI